MRLWRALVALFYDHGISVQPCPDVVVTGCVVIERPS